MVLLILSTIDILNQRTPTLIEYCTIFTVIGGAFAFASEWTVHSSNSRSLDNKKANKNNGFYALAYLCIIIVTAFLISLNYRYEDIMAIYSLLGIECIFLPLIIKIIPYESCLDNCGAFLNRVTIIYFLTWSIIRESL